MRLWRIVLSVLLTWPVAMIIWISGAWEYHPRKSRWHRFYLWLQDLLPTSAADYINWGDADFENMNYDDALGDFTEAIRLDPQLALAHLGRGKSYLRNEAFLGKEPSDLAIADLSEAIRLDPTMADAYYERAVALRARKPEQALADLTDALRLNPDHLNAHVMRGQMYARRGDWEQALAEFTEAVRLQPREPARYRMRAGAYRALGDETQAASDEQKAKELFAEQR